VSTPSEVTVRHTRHRTFVLLLVWCVAALTTSCSDDDDRRGTGSTAPTDGSATTVEGGPTSEPAPGPFAAEPFSIAAGLAELPTSLIAEGYRIQASDLDAASTLAGIDRSTVDVDDRGAFFDRWVGPVTGSGPGAAGPGVAALLPEAVSRQAVGNQPGLREELGFTLAEVTSFIESTALPNRFTVLNGTFDRDRLTEALGEPADGVWSLGGDDFARDPDAVSDVRPIGEALRLAARDGQVAVARSTPPITAWASGRGDTLADHASLLAAARALDGADVYAALLTDGPSQSLGSRAPAPATTVLAPYVVLGVGLTVADERAEAVFVYEHANADLAQDNGERLTTWFADDATMASGAALSAWFRDTVVEVDGSTVVLRAPLADEVRPASIWSSVFERDRLTGTR
jgi:hypothetical protein